MLHSDIMKLLIPFELGTIHTVDTALEGLCLDLGAERAADLLHELFPGSTSELIDAWERVYGLVPGFDGLLQLRQNRIIQKMRELGRLDRTYFIQLAAALGYQIVIEELCPFMAGWSCAGDELGDDASDWCWCVWYSEGLGYYFRAGESCAGEHLSYNYDETLFTLFSDLKPADTFVEFITI